MNLAAYFDLQMRMGHPISIAELARRAGLPASTVRSIKIGGGTRIQTGLRIERATDGLVRLEDLVAVPSDDPQGDRGVREYGSQLPDPRRR
jgi:hypothetical protein